MIRIPTFVRRRLERLRRRQEKQLNEPFFKRSSHPFRYDASFRIGGVGELHDDISQNTGLSPTRCHTKGQLRFRNSKKCWDEDIWVLKSPLGELVTLEEHLEWLWQTIRPHQAYFEKVIAKSTWSDVCLGCLSESAFPLLHVDASSLTIARELRLSLSFNFTCV